MGRVPWSCGARRGLSWRRCFCHIHCTSATTQKPSWLLYSGSGRHRKQHPYLWSANPLLCSSLAQVQRSSPPWISALELSPEKKMQCLSNVLILRSLEVICVQSPLSQVLEPLGGPFILASVSPSWEQAWAPWSWFIRHWVNLSANQRSHRGLGRKRRCRLCSRTVLGEAAKPAPRVPKAA